MRDIFTTPTKFMNSSWVLRKTNRRIEMAKDFDLEKAVEGFMAIFDGAVFCTTCRHNRVNYWGYHCTIHDCRLGVMSTACDDYEKKENKNEEEKLVQECPVRRYGSLQDFFEEVPSPDSSSIGKGSV